MVKDSNNKKISSLLEDLSLLESYAKELFSFTPIPIFFASPNGVILEVNPSLEKIMDKKDHEIIGEGVEKIFNEKEINEILKETLKKGFVRNKEISIINKEGQKILVSVFSQNRKNKEGNNIGCFFALIDLTEIKKKEEALKESEQVLEVRVAAKTKELQELADNLDSKVKERTEELEEQIEEMEKINKLMTGRELKMVKLKEKIEKLKKENNKLKKNLNQKDT